MLTSAQNVTLKAAINADPVLSLIPNTNEGADAVALELNKNPLVDFLVWMTNAPTQSILDAIDGSKYTPSDAIPTTTAELSNVYQSRILACQTKQISLQTLVIGRETVNAAKANIRSWLRDAVIQCPAGASGAMIAPGGASGATALTACLRKANRVEQILAAGSATTGTTAGNLLGYEGTVSYPDVFEARK